MVGTKKTTGISVYIDQWECWTAFKAKYSMYSGIDLFVMVLKEFIYKYDVFDDCFFIRGVILQMINIRE